MSKHVLILSSSPRAAGNSEALCTALAHGVRSVGNTATILDVAKLHIAPCDGCEYCYRHSNQCVYQDDMELVWDHMDRADVLIFASPIYFYNFSAQLMLVIDRLYSRYQAMHPRECALLLTCADGKSSLRAAKLCYQQIANSCKLINRGIIAATNVWEQGDIAQNPALDEAFHLGECL